MIYYEAICPAKKPYKLKEFATQDGSGIAVVYGKKEIGHHLSSPPPRYIKGDKVEWRFHYKHGKKYIMLSFIV